MASGLQSFRIDAEQQQSPASEGTRPHRPFLLGVLFGGLAVGGLVAVASPGRAEAKFVASPVGVGWGPGASFREVQAAARATGPMMAADTQGNADLLPGRREALATGAAGIAAGVGLFSGASEANAADDVNFKSSPIRNRLVRDAKEIDVNNVDVRAFTLLSDFSEEGAKKLAANAPYKGLTDMYARAGFSEAEKTSIKKYEQQLLFGNPKGKYTIQKANAADDVSLQSSPIRGRLTRDAKEIDVNNVDVRALLYVLADLSEEGTKKLATHAPYKGITDMYARAGFSAAEKTTLKKYEQQLLFGNPKGKYTMQKR